MSGRLGRGPPGGCHNAPSGLMIDSPSNCRYICTNLEIVLVLIFCRADVNLGMNGCALLFYFSIKNCMQMYKEEVIISLKLSANKNNMGNNN